MGTLAVHAEERQANRCARSYRWPRRFTACAALVASAPGRPVGCRGCPLRGRVGLSPPRRRPRNVCGCVRGLVAREHAPGRNNGPVRARRRARRRPGVAADRADLAEQDRPVEVAGQDLGSMFEADGKTWFVFGDTFSTLTPGMTGGVPEPDVEVEHPRVHHRHEPGRRDHARRLRRRNDNTGLAKELLSAKQIDNVEFAVIPTYGFAANGAIYLDYVSVKHFRIGNGVGDELLRSREVDGRRRRRGGSWRRRAGRETATSTGSASPRWTAISTSGASPTAGLAACS